MKITTIFAVYISVMLLAIGGCSSSPPAQLPAKPAPVAVDGGGPVDKNNDLPMIIFHVNLNDTESHQVVRNGTVLRWRGEASQFYIHFLADSPCDDSGLVDNGKSYPAYYASSSSASGLKSVAKCVVTKKSKGAVYGYEVLQQLPADPAPPQPSFPFVQPKNHHKPTHTTTPCKGCYIELNGDAD